MTFPLLKIRFKQFKRQLKDLGVAYSVLIFLALVVAGFFIMEKYSDRQLSVFISFAIVLIIFQLQSFRKDKHFVFNHMERPALNIFIEYAIFSLPLTALCLFTDAWFHFPLILISFYLIASLRFSISQKTRLSSLSKIISPKNFEWLSGVRKYSLYMAILLLLLVSTCMFPFVPLIILWLITTTAAGSFYIECESQTVLYSNFNSARQLIFGKIKSHSKLLAIISVPVLIINSIINPGMILINAIFLFVEFLLLTFAILLKYSVYRPNEQLTGNNIILAIMSIGVLIPFMLPLPLIMSIRNYKKSINNLNRYFRGLAN